MEKIYQEQRSQGSKAVDQLINTLDLLSCGILNFTLPVIPNAKGASPDPWEHLIEVREKLELARSLLVKNDPCSPKSERIAETIEAIAAQANWLALDTAIRSAHNGWLDLTWSPLNMEIDVLAERADAVANEMVDLFQETHYRAIHASWIESPSPAGLFSTLV